MSDTGKATFGVLMDSERIPFALTVENPWRDNRAFVSCIPEGTYICKRVFSPKFGNTFEVENVPDRTLIRFHWGNTDEDTRGCILVGEEFGLLGLEPAILSSKKGFGEFMRKLTNKHSFTLEIVSA